MIKFTCLELNFLTEMYIVSYMLHDMITKFVFDHKIMRLLGGMEFSS